MGVIHGYIHTYEYTHVITVAYKSSAFGMRKSVRVKRRYFCGQSFPVEGVDSLARA